MQIDITSLQFWELVYLDNRDAKKQQQQKERSRNLNSLLTGTSNKCEF